MLRDPLGGEGQENILGRESSSPNKAIAGSSPASVMDDSRAHKELLLRVTENLGLQVEAVSKGVDPMTHI